jgi:hypothetical protein
MKNGRAMRRLTAAITLALLSLAALMGASTGSGAQGPNLDPALCAPDENSFTLAIDNSFFPLPAGQQWVYTGKEQGQSLGLRITVLDATESFYRGRKTVTTRVVEEVEWEDTNGDGVIGADEPLIEVSFNYFAQSQDGTVCYFGEDVEIYEGGVVVSTEGSWRADAGNNAPGIFMPAEPEVGMSFEQEIAPGVAEDQATIVGTGTVKVPAGTFAGAIKVRDFNPLDGSKGFKFYAPGVGLIVDGPLRLISF